MLRNRSTGQLLQALTRTENDVQMLNSRRLIEVASRRVSQAVEVIADLQFTKRGGIPRTRLKQIAQYEDAIGLLKEAVTAATYELLLSQECPVCGSSSKAKVRLGDTRRRARA
jgi:hypothetical protein